MKLDGNIPDDPLSNLNPLHLAHHCHRSNATTMNLYLDPIQTNRSRRELSQPAFLDLLRHMHIANFEIYPSPSSVLSIVRAFSAIC